MKKKIIIIIFLALALLLGFLFVWPNYQKLQLTEQTVEEKRIEIKYKEDYFQDLKKAFQEIEKYQEQLEKIDSALPSEPDLAVVLNFIKNSGIKSGIILTEIETSPAKPSLETRGLKETEISFTVLGPYPAFRNFLSDLEQTSRMIKIESISFSSKENIRNFNLKIKTYGY